MEEFILKGRREQIFTSFFLPQLILGFIPNFDTNIYLIKIVLISLVYIVWIYMLGRALNACIPARFRLSETFQQIFLFVFVIIFVPLLMFSDLVVTFYGWAVWIPFMMLFSLVYLFYFASKALTSAEKGRRTSFGDHIAELFLLLFAWVGIWFIQPRINKLWEENKNRFEEEE